MLGGTSLEVKVLEFFAGTRSVSKAFEKAGHQTFTIDWDQQHEDISWYADVSAVTSEEILKRFGRPDIIWASPDCKTYSVAGISHHRFREPDGNLAPISPYAEQCDNTNRHLLKLIEELKPKYFFIENPRGALRKMNFIQAIPRYTVTYCQYEMDKPLEKRRMKPTDLFTNHPEPNFRPTCKNGDTCHVSAKRGSRTGTQGIKGSVDRSRIPEELCDHIVKISTE